MTEEIKVRVSGTLLKFVEERTGADGLYTSVNEYLRDLIRRDFERMEDRELARLAAQIGIPDDEDEDGLLDMLIGTDLLEDDEPPTPGRR